MSILLRRAAVCLALGLLPLLLLPPAWADNPVAAYHAIRRASLKGIKSVEVVVSADSDAACRHLPTEQLETAIEAQLQEGGIQHDPSAVSYLFVSVNSLAALTESLCALDVSVDLQQAVALVRDLRITTFGTTWHEGGLGVTATEQRGEFLRMMLDALVGKFINAYLEQNPKQ